MVGRTTAGMQEQLLKLLIAFSEGNADVVLDLIVKSSDATEEFDEEEYRRRGGLVVVRQRTKAAGAVDIGTAMLEMTRISADCGLQTPSSLTLLGKTLFDPNAAVKRHASQILSERVWKGISPSNLLTPAFEMKDFVAGLPGRLNKLLDAAGNAELEIRVRSPETDHLMSAFQKIANRITTGIVLAALIVGASLLMHVDTSFRLFGYPGLAMIFFLVAAGGGLWLVFTVLIQDARDRRKARR
jgi:predicted unusual protein kinase regulating ubiquinone biosynthesis (AarF/ABC1/UbiB family)